MENLYMSANICWLVLEMPKQLIIHRVTRPTLRGVPLCVKQDEAKKKGELEVVQNTAKVALLQGDSIFKDIVCV